MFYFESITNSAFFKEPALLEGIQSDSAISHNPSIEEPNILNLSSYTGEHVFTPVSTIYVIIL